MDSLMTLKSLIIVAMCSACAGLMSFILTVAFFENISLVSAITVGTGGMTAIIVIWWLASHPEIESKDGK